MDKKAQWSLVGAAWFAAISVTVFGYLNWKRGEDNPPAQTAPSAQSLVPQSNGSVRCPVTGELLQVGPNTPTVDYRGQVYYFSTSKDAQGNDARTRFLMDPDHYLNAAARP